MTNRERALEAALRAMTSSGQGYVKHGLDIHTPGAGCPVCAALALPPSPQPSPVAEGDHTPGPWHINYHGGQTTDAYVWGPDGTKRGCIASVNLCGLDRDDFTARSGNARLIAAAPDMLAALQKADEALQAAEQHVLCASGQELKEVTRGRARIRAAIARATGRES